MECEEKLQELWDSYEECDGASPEAQQTPWHSALQAARAALLEGSFLGVHRSQGPEQ